MTIDVTNLRRIADAVNAALAEDMALFGHDAPPAVTPGVVRSVLVAAGYEQIVEQNRRYREALEKNAKGEQ